MKKIKIILLLLMFGIILQAQNTNPEVTNLRFEQRTDGTHKVDIYYDLYDADGNAMTVTMEVSADAGQSYTLQATSLSGDIGANITSGNNRHIVWDFGIDHPNYFSDQIKVKIIADDGQGGGIGECGEPIEFAGKTYNTVQIGDQCWLKENLDVGTMINSTTSGYQQTNNNIIEKYCFDNNPANCEIYGGLYEWPEVMQYVTTEGAQGICPDGWHIPTLAEFEELETFVGDQAAKLVREDQPTSGYTPTNETGFSALFAGLRYYYSIFDCLGSYAFFWSSTESNSSLAYHMNLHYYFSNVGNLFDYATEGGFSVRCVQD